jgi:type II secretory pathway component GspD/PulD (secretin)
VPYLHSIPLIGSLFRNDEISDQRKELLIFVTPRIVAVQPAAI